MKKIFSILAITALAASTTAQNLKNGAAAPNPEVAAPASVTANPKGAASVSNLSVKALRDFEKGFKNSGDVKWYSMPDGVRANFRSGDITYRVDYDKHGNRLDIIRIYDEKHLPQSVRSMIKSNYYDYAITLVEEIEKSPNGITYIVHLEGTDEWINLKVQNSEMEEWQKFAKAK